MIDSSEPLESFWDQILSRKPELVRSAFDNLNEIEQKAVMDHLRRMATEEGWHPEQRTSALAAIAALETS